MKLTPLEIKQQTFDKALRGYDPAEVQAFLNLVASEWEHLANRNRELTSQIEQLNEKLKHYERVESALHETLQTARESAEQKLGGAKQESRNILDKAENEAETIIRDAYLQRQEIRQSVIRLIDKRNEMVAGIRSYLENAQGSLQQFSRDEGDLFSIPPAEENRSKQNRGEPGEQADPAEDLTKTQQDKTKQRSDSSHSQPGISGTDSEVDDILDEIE